MNTTVNSSIDLFGGGDLLFASPKSVFAPLTVTPLEPNAGQQNGATGANEDPLLDLFGSPGLAPANPVKQPEAKAAGITGEDLMESIMAAVSQQPVASKTSEGPGSGTGSGADAKSSGISAEAKAFLDQIPDLSFILSSELQLPGLANAPQALNAAKRNSIGAAFEALDDDESGLF